MIRCLNTTCVIRLVGCQKRATHSSSSCIMAQQICCEYLAHMLLQSCFQAKLHEAASKVAVAPIPSFYWTCMLCVDVGNSRHIFIGCTVQMDAYPMQQIPCACSRWKLAK
ncbi:hypothetical protein ABBQ38_008953 [Trebouxia sp. C0009 RCD-2024]